MAINTSLLPTLVAAAVGDGDGMEVDIAIIMNFTPSRVGWTLSNYKLFAFSRVILINLSAKLGLIHKNPYL